MPVRDPGSLPLTPAENKVAVERLRKAVDLDYSYRDLRVKDWGRLFGEFADPLEGARTPREFAKTLVRLLAHAEDTHIRVNVGERSFRTCPRRESRNVNPTILPRLIPRWHREGPIVATGRFDDGVRYVSIDSWADPRGEALEPAYEALREGRDDQGLIVDVRLNQGGREDLAQQFAGCFVDVRRVYARHVNRIAGNFSMPSDRILEPNRNRPAYRGRVAVLSGPLNVSSGESFLLMMKQVRGCRLVGQRSYGSSGNPQPVVLGNGVTVMLPRWKALRPDGSCFEGEGIAPDIEVSTEEKDLADRDPVLEAALSWLRSGLSRQ